MCSPTEKIDEAEAARPEYWSDVDAHGLNDSAALRPLLREPTTREQTASRIRAIFDRSGAEGRPETMDELDEIRVLMSTAVGQARRLRGQPPGRTVHARSGEDEAVRAMHARSGEDEVLRDGERADAALRDLQAERVATPEDRKRRRDLQARVDDARLVREKVEFRNLAQRVATLEAQARSWTDTMSLVAAPREQSAPLAPVRCPDPTCEVHGGAGRKGVWWRPVSVVVSLGAILVSILLPGFWIWPHPMSALVLRAVFILPAVGAALVYHLRVRRERAAWARQQHTGDAPAFQAGEGGSSPDLPLALPPAVDRRDSPEWR